MSELILYKTVDDVFVDRRKLNTLTPEQLSETMEELYAPEAPRVVFIENGPTFFSMKNLETAIAENGEHLNTLLGYHGIVLVPEDLAAVRRAKEVQQYITDCVKQRREAMRPEYPFADLPTGWVLEDKLDIGTRMVKRKNGNYYSIGFKGAKALWDFCSVRWANPKVPTTGYPGNPTVYVKASGTGASVYNYNVQSAYVDVGCQKIERYELEQLALHQGWDFPKPELVDQE